MTNNNRKIELNWIGESNKIDKSIILSFDSSNTVLKTIRKTFFVTFDASNETLKYLNNLTKP